MVDKMVKTKCFGFDGFWHEEGICGALQKSMDACVAELSKWNSFRAQVFSSSKCFPPYFSILADFDNSTQAIRQFF
jgi:hypothetical protein